MATEHRIVLYVLYVLYVRNREGNIRYELEDSTTGRLLLLGELPESMSDYAQGEALVVMETPEVRQARIENRR